LKGKETDSTSFLAFLRGGATEISMCALIQAAQRNVKKLQLQRLCYRMDKQHDHIVLSNSSTMVASDSSCQLNIPLHDSNAFCMDRTKVPNESDTGRDKG